MLNKMGRSLTDVEEKAPEHVRDEVLQFSNVPDGQGIPDEEITYDPSKIAEPPPPPIIGDILLLILERVIEIHGLILMAINYKLKIQLFYQFELNLHCQCSRFVSASNLSSCIYQIRKLKWNLEH